MHNGVVKTMNYKSNSKEKDKRALVLVAANKHHERLYKRGLNHSELEVRNIYKDPLE